MDNDQIKSMDPNMLLSIINMKLRDSYSNLETLCDDMDIEEDIIIQKLNKIGYEYYKESNQFK
ncbi:MAG: DUF4250 domain-containing protein [Clostridium sp.]|nr:DUF4250 domain-containing protein [Clostridium sp.]